MINTNCQKFKGEIENYLRNGQNNLESKIDKACSSLKFQTCCASPISLKKTDTMPPIFCLF